MRKILILLALLIAVPASAQIKLNGNIKVSGPFKLTVPVITARITDNLSAFYECQPGVTADSTANALTLTNNNTVTSENSPAIVGNFCRFQTAFGQYLNRADNALLDAGTGDFAVAFWFNTPSATAFQVLISKGGTGTADPGWLIGINSAANEIFSLICVTGACGGINSTATGLANSAWHHVLINFVRAGVNEIYVDGILGGIDYGATSIGNADNALDFLIAKPPATWGNATIYNGFMDQIGIWKGRTIPSGEVTWLYNAGAGRSYSQMVAH